MEYHTKVMGDEGARRGERERETAASNQTTTTSTTGSNSNSNSNSTTARPYDAARSPSQSDYNPPPFSPSRPPFNPPYAPAAAPAAATAAPAAAAAPVPSRNYYDPTKPEVPADDRRPSWHEAQTPQVREASLIPHVAREFWKWHG